MSHSFCKLLAWLLALLSTTAAMGKTSLKIDIGWNGGYRAGHWAPVYLTIPDDMAIPARNVIIQIVAPHDKTFALKIYTSATIRQETTTILLYVALTLQLDETAAVIIDATNGKKLAEMPFENNQNPNGPYGRAYRSYGNGGGEILLGVSGAAQHGMGVLKGQFKWLDESQPVTPQP